MKKPFIPALVLSLLAVANLAHADNDRWHSRSYSDSRTYTHESDEHREHHGGFRHFRNDWGWSPLAAAAVIGTTVYLANSIANTPPVTVTVSPPVAVTPPRTAYFCAATQQYYPAVPTCPMPWQVVNY